MNSNESQSQKIEFVWIPHEGVSRRVQIRDVKAVMSHFDSAVVSVKGWNIEVSANAQDMVGIRSYVNQAMRDFKRVASYQVH